MGQIEMRGEVAVPYGTVRRALLFSPEDLLAGGRRDPTTLFEASVGDLQMAVRVTVHVRAFHEEEDPVRSCTRGFDVSAESHPGWYPILDGVLQADDAGAVTQVSLGGAYRPPGGTVGKALDAAKLHEVAEVSIGRYFDQLLLRLEEL